MAEYGFLVILHVVFLGNLLHLLAGAPEQGSERGAKLSPKHCDTLPLLCNILPHFRNNRYRAKEELRSGMAFPGIWEWIFYRPAFSTQHGLSFVWKQEETALLFSDACFA